MDPSSQLVMCLLLCSHSLPKGRQVPGSCAPRSRRWVSMIFLLEAVIFPHSGETVMFFARGLAPCSNYTLHIVPQFGDFSFEAISARASTHLGDCEEDLMEDDIEEISSSAPPSTVKNIQQQSDFQTKRRSSSTSSHVLFLSRPVLSLSVILLFCFS